MRVYSRLGAAPCCMGTMNAIGLGQERTLRQPEFALDRTETSILEREEQMEQRTADNGGFPWWGWLGVGLGVVTIGGVLYMIFK